MPKIADVITIDHARHRLLVDGEEFPWHVTEGVTVEFDRPIAMVTLTIPAEHVEHVPARHDRG